jgi:hypothetical protein
VRGAAAVSTTGSDDGRRNTGSTVLRLTYGYDTLAKQDPFIMQTDRALAGNTQATAIWLADYYPIRM